jgi:hypothetical protein
MLSSNKQHTEPKRYTDFQSPLRCGKLIVNGEMHVGRLHVDKILDWEDITDGQGRTLVTSWPRDAKMFIEEWV